MPIVKKIKYKGQVIEIVLKKYPSGSAYNYRIKYFPKVHNIKCAWKMLQDQTNFLEIDNAIKEAKLKIDAEFEKNNWVKPTEDVFKDCKYE